MEVISNDHDSSVLNWQAKQGEVANIAIQAEPFGPGPDPKVWVPRSQRTDALVQGLGALVAANNAPPALVLLLGERDQAEQLYDDEALVELVVLLASEVNSN